MKRGIPNGSLETDSLVKLKKLGVESAVLDARLRWAAAEGFRRYAAPLVEQVRVYPNYLPTQSSGRWSVTNPPLINFPNAAKAKKKGLPDLTNCVGPDIGTWWLCSDWDAMHACFMAAMSDDLVDIQAFRDRDDVHSITAVQVFRWSTHAERLVGAQAALQRLRPVRGAVLPAGLLQPTSREVLLQEVQRQRAAWDQGSDYQRGLSPSLGGWEARLGSPASGRGYPGDGCPSSEWKQAGQQTGEPRTDDEARAHALAWAAWTHVGGPPPDWAGKGDRRRHLMKTTRYALLNAYDEKGVLEAKEVEEQGLTFDELLRAGRAFLVAKPGMVAFKESYCRDAIQRGEARSLYGRRRKLFGSDYKEKFKTAISHFLQGTEVDIMEQTLIEVCTRFPEARLAWPSHDGLKFVFPDALPVEVVLPVVRAVVERPRVIGRHEVPLWATWEVIREGGEHLSL